MLRRNLLVLNSCPLGANEVAFWNSFNARFGSSHEIIFLSDAPPDDLEIEQKMQVNYNDTSFSTTPDNPSPELAAIINRVSEKQKIWETYEEDASENSAYSWLVSWTLLVRALKPVCVIVWNGHHLPEAALTEVARLEGVDCFFAERGPLAGTFALDPNGVNCFSRFHSNNDDFQVEGTLDDLEKFKDIYFRKGTSNWNQPERILDKKEFSARFGIPANKRVLFFPTQLDRDINSKLFSPHFESTFDALEELVNWCDRRSDEVFLLVKKHPLQEANEQFQELSFKSGAWVEDVHIFDCIEYCDAVVSVNSSVAIEAALVGKPVLLLGESILNHSAAVFSLNSAGGLAVELETLLAATHDNGSRHNDEFFRKLLFGYLYTANREYLDLGVRSVAGFSLAQHKKSSKREVILEKGITSLESIVPSFQSPSLLLQASETRRLELSAELHEKNDHLAAVENKLASIQSRLSYRVLKKLKLI